MSWTFLLSWKKKNFRVGGLSKVSSRKQLAVRYITVSTSMCFNTMHVLTASYKTIWVRRHCRGHCATKEVGDPSSNGLVLTSESQLSVKCFVMLKSARKVICCHKHTSDSKITFNLSSSAINVEYTINKTDNSCCTINQSVKAKYIYTQPVRLCWIIHSKAIILNWTIQLQNYWCLCV